MSTDDGELAGVFGPGHQWPVGAADCHTAARYYVAEQLTPPSSADGRDGTELSSADQTGVPHRLELASNSESAPVIGPTEASEQANRIHPGG